MNKILTSFTYNYQQLVVINWASRKLGIVLQLILKPLRMISFIRYLPTQQGNLNFYFNQVQNLNKTDNCFLVSVVDRTNKTSIFTFREIGGKWELQETALPSFWSASLHATLVHAIKEKVLKIVS